MNYLQYVYQAVDAATSKDVYAYAAPQGLTTDYIIITITSSITIWSYYNSIRTSPTYVI